MPIAQIIRAHANTFYVLLEGREFACQPRGKFRLTETTVRVGDAVEVTPLAAGEGRIERVLPRRNELTRPPIANVDQAALVFTRRDPDTGLLLLDRFLVHAERAGIRVLIVLNKVDLMTPAEVAEFAAAYGGLGYPVYPISARQGTGLDALVPALAGRITVLAGASGAGKSRLSRALLPGQAVRVGELSEKLRRGRHTTRHVELMPLPGGGLLADTPGFTYLEFEGIEAGDLARYFPELGRLHDRCRFADCRHRAEPDCAVLAAVAAGAIARSRYDHYLQFLAEIEEKKRW